VEAKDRSAAQVGPGEGRALWVLGERVTLKVASEQTGGAYSLFEVVSQPQGGPLPHIQHREDECFYVLEGEFEFLNNDCISRAGAGSLVYVPKGNLHAYKNVGNEPGRMLVSQTPGGLHERFFEELGEWAKDRSKPVPEEPPNAQRIVTIAAKYGIEISPLPEGWSGDGKETQG
jgi:mannose-6-phosphate isomerase-like protein (cupin superfamily)